MSRYSLLLIIIISFILFVGMDSTCCEGGKSGRYELVAFTGDSKTEGTFFLLDGNINQEFVYRYLYKTDGGIKQEWCYIKSATIYESSDIPPYVSVDCAPTKRTDVVKFTIPKGSIKRNYELDINKNQ